MAFAALKDEKTLAESSSEYDMHVNQFQTWRNQLKEKMARLFDTSLEQRKDQDAEVKSLQAKID